MNKKEWNLLRFLQATQKQWYFYVFFHTENKQYGPNRHKIKSRTLVSKECGLHTGCTTRKEKGRVARNKTTLKGIISWTSKCKPMFKVSNDQRCLKDTVLVLVIYFSYLKQATQSNMSYSLGHAAKSENTDICRIPAIYHINDLWYLSFPETCKVRQHWHLSHSGDIPGQRSLIPSISWDLKSQQYWD